MMWKTLKSENVLDTAYVSVEKHDVLTESGVRIDDFYTVTVHDAVGIIALTAEGKILLKKEYRYSRRAETIEIPAGMIEPEEKDPLLAAQRELREETGYESDEWTYVGPFAENTSKLTNTMHIYLAENCRKTHAQHTDAGEDIELMETGLQEAADMVMKRQISDATSAFGILYASRKSAV